MGWYGHPIRLLPYQFSGNWFLNRLLPHQFQVYWTDLASKSDHFPTPAQKGHPQDCIINHKKKRTIITKMPKRPNGIIKPDLIDGMNQES
jgi:hypothetical protein